MSSTLAMASTGSRDFLLEDAVSYSVWNTFEENIILRTVSSVSDQILTFILQDVLVATRIL